MRLTDIDQVDFDKAGGLVPAVIQHARSGAVLMVGYMNRDALLATLECGRVVFFSRSRQRLWKKGETSGQVLEVTAIHADCDRDALLVIVMPRGPVCHTGAAGCFGELPLTEAEALSFLATLEGIIEQRIAGSPNGSYTSRLFAQGPLRIAQKVGEEGLEVALAAAAAGDSHVVSESADLMFHLLVLLRSRGLSLANVVAELLCRHAAKS